MAFRGALPRRARLVAGRDIRPVRERARRARWGFYRAVRYTLDLAYRSDAGKVLALARSRSTFSEPVYPMDNLSTASEIVCIVRRVYLGSHLSYNHGKTCRLR